jgi:hypothetical protein
MTKIFMTPTQPTLLGSWFHAALPLAFIHCQQGHHRTFRLSVRSVPEIGLGGLSFEGLAGFIEPSAR